MKLLPTELTDVILIEPEVFGDERGFFLESYNAEEYAAAGISESFVQDNHSFSRCGTLRGLHAQYRRPQAKLVRVVEGEVYDVVVDIRRGSPTFKRWVAVTLSARNHRQLYIPQGFAHGFCVLSEAAHFEYKVSDYYDPQGELTVLWNDPELRIDWPIQEPTLSKKDISGRPFADLLDLFPTYEDSRGEGP